MIEEIKDEVQTNDALELTDENKEQFEIKYEDPEYPFRMKSLKARKKLKKIIAEYSTSYIGNADLTIANQLFINAMVKLGVKYPDLYHPYVMNDIIDYVNEHYSHLNKTITAFCDKIHAIYVKSFSTDLDDSEELKKLEEKSEQQAKQDLEFETLETNSVISTSPKIEKVESKIILPY
jgi:aspartyl-tRNA synthetase